MINRVGPVIYSRSVLINSIKQTSAPVSPTSTISSTRAQSSNSNEQINQILTDMASADEAVRSSGVQTLINLMDQIDPANLENQLITPLINFLNENSINTAYAACWAIRCMLTHSNSSTIETKIIDLVVSAIKSNHILGRSINDLFSLLGEAGLSDELMDYMVDALFSALRIQCETDTNEASSPPASHSCAQALSAIFSSEASAPIKNLISETALTCLSDQTDQYKREAGSEVLAEINLEDSSSRQLTAMYSNITGLLADTNTNVRRNAALLSRNLACSELSLRRKAALVEPLIGALQDSDPRVREFAIDALIELAKEDIPSDQKKKMVGPLMALLQDPQSRYSALDALATLAGTDIPTSYKEQMVAPILEIIGSLNENTMWLSFNAANVLGCLAGSEIAPHLKALMIAPLLNILPYDTYLYMTTWRFEHRGMPAAWALTQLAQAELPEGGHDQLYNGLFDAMSGSNRQTAAYALSSILRSNIPDSTEISLTDKLLVALSGDNCNLQENIFYIIDDLAGSSAVLSQTKSKFVAPLLDLLASPNTDFSCTLPSGSRLRLEWALRALAGSDISPELKVRMIDPLMNAHLSEALIKILESNVPDGQKRGIMDYFLDNRDTLWHWFDIVRSVDISSELKILLVDPLLLALQSNADDENTRRSIISALRHLLEVDIPESYKIRIREALE